MEQSSIGPQSKTLINTLYKECTIRVETELARFSRDYINEGRWWDGTKSGSFSAENLSIIQDNAKMITQSLIQEIQEMYDTEAMDLGSLFVDIPLG